MASIRITQFGGLMPEVHGKLVRETNAQIAHNCILLDGKLRPQAQWVPVGRVGFSEGSMGELHLSYAHSRGQAYAYFMHKNPVTLEGTPFATETVVGVDGRRDLVRESIGGSPQIPVRFPTASPSPWEVTVTYTRSYDSIKPINRLYAVSYVREYNGRKEESPLYVLPNQEPTDIVYEGDLVSISAQLWGGVDTTHVRLYRTITGLDTGTAVTNELDTNWHLVSEIPLTTGSIQYVDGSSATALPMDVGYSTQFAPLSIEPHWFGVTESGWFVAADLQGNIQISERFMHHAWPVENQLTIPEALTDMVVSGDNVYFGTKGNPYIMAVSFGDKAMQARIDKYQEHLPCLYGTMTATPSGALYCSGQGLVSLSRNGIEVITRELVNQGIAMATRVLTREREVWGPEGPTVETQYIPVAVSTANTGLGHYHAGKYYGFCPKREPFILREF